MRFPVRVTTFCVLFILANRGDGQRVHVKPGSVNGVRSQDAITLHKESRSDAVERNADSSSAVFQMPFVDVAKAMAEDDRESREYGDAIPGGWKFGETVDVKIDIHEDGIWSTHDGLRVWSITVDSHTPDSALATLQTSPSTLLKANTLSFLFDPFHLPEGALLWIESEDRNFRIGPFSNHNLLINGTFLTQPVFGGVVTLHYTEPADLPPNQVQLKVKTIVYGYRGFGAMKERGKQYWRNRNATVRQFFGESDSCNPNVCEYTDAHTFDISNAASSTFLMVNGRQRLCTGVMVANVARDCNLEFGLTAGHCVYDTVGSMSYYGAMFNYESCDGNDGPTTQTCIGAVIQMKSSHVDAALLKFVDCKSEQYNVYRAGLELGTRMPKGALILHHPMGDVKKYVSEVDESGIIRGEGSTYRIVSYTEGITEPGSSGAPLFNYWSGLLHGLLWRGEMTCGCEDTDPTCFDEYGMLYKIWNNGNQFERLNLYLNPDDELVSYIRGLQCPLHLTSLSVNSWTGCYGLADDIVITITNNGGKWARYSVGHDFPSGFLAQEPTITYPNGETSLPPDGEAILYIQVNQHFLTSQYVRTFSLTVMREVDEWKPNPIGDETGEIAPPIIPLTFYFSGPEIPRPLEPVDAEGLSFNKYQTVTLRWRGGPQSTRFKIMFSTDHDAFNAHIFKNVTVYAKDFPKYNSDFTAEFTEWFPFSKEMITFYWTVESSNECVYGVRGPIWEFSIIPPPMECTVYPRTKIPDYSSEYLTLPVPHTRAMNGLYVALDHSYSSDIEMYLEHPDPNFYYTRMHLIRSSSGCNRKFCKNYPIVFTDFAPEEDYDCTSYPMADTGPEQYCIQFDHTVRPYKGIFALLPEGSEDLTLLIRDVAEDDTGSLTEVCALEVGQGIYLEPNHVDSCSDDEVFIEIMNPEGYEFRRDVKDIVCRLYTDEWDGPKPRCELERGPVPGQTPSSDNPIRLVVFDICPNFCFGEIQAAVYHIPDSLIDKPYYSNFELESEALQKATATVSVADNGPTSFFLYQPGIPVPSGNVNINELPRASSPVYLTWQHAGSESSPVEYEFSLYNNEGMLLQYAAQHQAPQYLWEYNDQDIDETVYFKWTVVGKNACGRKNSETFYFRPVSNCRGRTSPCEAHSDCCSRRCSQRTCM
mmetsp:Transcript_17810/g.50141  ORF Transcript_17810/g.50141 Transcript_17810/m.50141 type:complete len:1154 (+) Transcript_17810:101-3562(+)